MSPPQPGLKWQSTLLGYEPCWTVEPRIDIIKGIASKTLHIPQRDIIVKFHSQGAFNKLYIIQCRTGYFMMRVSLPVDPEYKTLSEVATLDFVRQNTDIPVPKVVAFDVRNDNELGFEWIIMERMPGKPVSAYWRTMSFDTKVKLVKRLALFAAQLFRQKFDHLGNLYRAGKHGTSKPENTSPTNFAVDRIVSNQFFWADHISQDVPRGPFKSSQEWLSARLLFHQNDSERTIRTSDDEDDIQDAKNFAQNIGKLVSLLPSVFRSVPEGSPDETVLLHDDMSQENVMVDQDGRLTAIVDWECVSALPLWKVCQLPVLLEGRERSEMPVKSNYVLDENGVVNELFWDHQLEYEQTQLRRVFLDEMQRIEPAWIDTYSARSSQRKADFELAIQHSDSELCVKLLGEWLDQYRRGGEIPRLKQHLAAG